MGLQTRTPDSAGIYIIAVRCSCIGPHSAVRAYVVVISIGVENPLVCSHVAVGIKVVPYTVDLLPAGCRIGSIVIPVPVSYGIQLPSCSGAGGAACGYGVAADVIQRFRIYGPALGTYPFALVGSNVLIYAADLE